MIIRRRMVILPALSVVEGSERTESKISLCAQRGVNSAHDVYEAAAGGDPARGDYVQRASELEKDGGGDVETL